MSEININIIDNKRLGVDVQSGVNGQTVAANVNIADTGNLYTATTVEGALQEAMTSVNTKANQSTTYTKTEVNTALDLKANKAQEAWITPTLLNSWVNNSGFTTRYKKDDMGVVWCELFINAGNTSSIIFNLPTGYRPSQSLFITGNASGVTSQIIIAPGGTVTHSVGTNTSAHRYVFSFRTN